LLVNSLIVLDKTLSVFLISTSISVGTWCGVSFAYVLKIFERRRKKILKSNIIIVLLIFGNVTDIFTGQTFDLCTFNFTLFDAYCPPGVHLTPENFIHLYTKCNLSEFNLTMPDLLGNVREQSLYLTSTLFFFVNNSMDFVNINLVIGCAIIIVGYIQVAFWSMACERQTRRIRERLFRAILSKEIAYFDTHKTGQLNTRLNDDVTKIHDGIGDKVASAGQFLAGFCVGLGLG